ncbi:hypothetical protein D4764_0192230 [Takifugu flavidus]|uniref:Uncharacterized protein n=1 Tax=Takifugu flavidus TaxID=433684 RepID=A0A5C6MLF7_9TELE|nr:hypothetical protein D4764_0192230 [Takifugu flavidus]
MKTLDERRSLLKELFICYKCLSSTEHRAKNCKAVIHCVECNSDSHPSAMHPGPPPWTDAGPNAPPLAHDGESDTPSPTVTTSSCTEIPNNRGEIPTLEAAAAHPHLSHIATQIPPLDPSADILLLLGRDVIQAHKVRRQINGSNKAPYAQQLDLGGEPYAVMADVEQMFHNFMVIAIYGLKRTAVEGESEYGSDVRKFIEQHFYVDDGLKSFASEDEAINVLIRAQRMLAQSNIRLHKISSNSSAVTSAFPGEDLATGLQGLELGQHAPPLQHSLGLGWDLSTDQFSFRVEINDQPFTKRGVLSVINSLYDPLAVGAVAYLKLTAADGHSDGGFLLGKARLAPKPDITIPRRTKFEIQGRESVGESKCPEDRRNPSEEGEEEEVRGRGARKVVEESLEDAGRRRESLGSLERCWVHGTCCQKQQ